MDLGWPIVISSLLFLSYGAWAISREKDLYLQTAMPMSLGNFTLLIPAWWSKGKESALVTDEFIFHRQDTNYDWRCGVGRQLSAGGPLASLIEQLQLSFDDESSYELPWSKLSPEFDAAHVEGTATRREEDRVYADILCLYHRSTGEALYIWSISSILNGCVEGPYVEEVMKRLLFKEKPITLTLVQ